MNQLMKQPTDRPTTHRPNLVRKGQHGGMGPHFSQLLVRCEKVLVFGARNSHIFRFGHSHTSRLEVGRGCGVVCSSRRFTIAGLGCAEQTHVLEVAAVEAWWTMGGLVVISTLAYKVCKVEYWS